MLQFNDHSQNLFLEEEKLAKSIRFLIENNDVGRLRSTLSQTSVVDNKKEILNCTFGTFEGFMMNAFMFAAYKGDVENIKYLIDLSINPSVLNNVRHTALTFAIMNNHIEIVRLICNLTESLISNINCDYNLSINCNYALSSAVFYTLGLHKPNLEAMEILIQHKANLNTINQAGYSALFYAAKANNIDALRLLLLKGDIEEKTICHASSQGTVLIYAINLKNYQFVTELMNLTQKSQLKDIPDAYGVTPLKFALENKDQLLTKALVNTKAINPFIEKLQDDKVKKYYLELMKNCPSNNFLLTTIMNIKDDQLSSNLLKLTLNIAEINTPNAYNLTPFMAASMLGLTETTRELLLKKADISMIECHGLTAEILAKIFGHKYAIEIVSAEILENQTSL